MICAGGDGPGHIHRIPKYISGIEILPFFFIYIRYFHPPGEGVFTVWVS